MLRRALAPEAERIHSSRENNVLVRGRVVRGDVEKALAESDVVVEGEYETGFIEHAYIEPEAGFARRVNDKIEIQACTQAPYMDRADIAQILGIAAEAVRIIPTAVGGGFGAKTSAGAHTFVAALLATTILATGSGAVAAILRAADRADRAARRACAPPARLR